MSVLLRMAASNTTVQPNWAAGTQIWSERQDANNGEVGEAFDLYTVARLGGGRAAEAQHRDWLQQRRKACPRVHLRRPFC